MKRALFALITLATIAAGLTSCSDNVDDSNMYVFSGKTIADFVKEDPDLSNYYFMLQHARSGKKGSTMDHLLEARGNYTVFAPTNAAVQHYLDSIFATPNYDINQTPDSVAQDIVFNSIIDTESSEAYKTTTFQEGTFDYKTMADRFATVSFGTNYTAPMTDGRPLPLLRLLIRLPKPMNKYRDPKLNTPDKRRQK